jgi:hypothetical protein
VWIEDQGSHNATWVQRDAGAARIHLGGRAQPARVAVGTMIYIARLRFRVEAAS